VLDTLIHVPTVRRLGNTVPANVESPFRPLTEIQKTSENAVGEKRKKGKGIEERRTMIEMNTRKVEGYITEISPSRKEKTERVVEKRRAAAGGIDRTPGVQAVEMIGDNDVLIHTRTRATLKVEGAGRTTETNTGIKLVGR